MKVSLSLVAPFLLGLGWTRGLQAADSDHRELESTQIARTCGNSLLQNAPLNLGIVIDISYSTIDTTFGGTSIGDVNGDGKSNTILDAEIDSVLKLLDKILADPNLNNGNILLGFVLFHTEAQYITTKYAPLSADGRAINPALITFLKGIRCPGLSNGNGYTNMDDALDKSILFFQDPALPLERKNVLVFLSDGKPTVRGDGDNEGWCNPACTDVPPNKADEATTPLWEKGQISFCFAGDSSCGSHPKRECVRGTQYCDDSINAMLFTNELKRLDELKVYRLAIGIGGSSDCSRGSALDKIDSNPNKEAGILPYQVFTTDTLNDAMKTLCVEAPPIAQSPTAKPVKPPTAKPTLKPTMQPIENKRGCETRSVLSNPPLNLAIAIDISQSTYRITFTGTAIGDVNGDGKANTIMDAEIQAVLDLLQVILEDPTLDNNVIDIGFIPFETNAFYKGKYMPKGRYPPLSADGKSVNPELVRDLKLIRTSLSDSLLTSTNIGFTNFDDALDKTIDYYLERGTEVTKRNNVLIFISDGVPTVRGDGDNEPWCKNAYTTSCGSMPANKVPPSGAYQWNKGELSFCNSGDTQCQYSSYNSCVRGRGSCAGTPGVQSFASELAKLNEMGVMRIPICVGAECDTSKGAALDMIDSNTDETILPMRVMSTDDLRKALQTLCIEGTATPTKAPVQPLPPPPTKKPTKKPTNAPTWSPTESPTQDAHPGCVVASLLSSPPLNLAIVIDISYSTYSDLFSGSIGDVNKDGKANTIIDAEIQAVLDLLDTIAEDRRLNNGNVDIGIILFDTEAQYKGEYVTLGHYTPFNPNGIGVNEVLKTHLLSIRTPKSGSEVSTTNRGYTNFDDALDKAIEYFEDPGTDTNRNNVMIFLSDGVPNVRGDGDMEPWCKPSSCTYAPANKADTAYIISERPWESGQLSFCTRGDTLCKSSSYQQCARGVDWCQNTAPAMSYQSELARLDTYHVNRIAIGVGGSADCSKGSALELIDNNPNKSKGVLPFQAFSLSELSKAIRSLCLDDTRPPTKPPVAPPPTKKPTASPTKKPTKKPTTKPTKKPTAAPSQSPTVGCDGDSILTSPTLNLAIVIDISHSTYRDTFSGTPIGDINNDGKSNTVLDAEIKAVLDLLDVIKEDPEKNNNNVNIGIILFDTEGQYKGEYATEGHYNPLSADGKAVNPTLVSHLKSIKTAINGDQVSKLNWGYTNFDDALDKAIDYFEDDAVDTDRTNVMLFISDGVPNVRGDGDNEAWCPHSSSCTGAPANKPDAVGTDPWEKGALSFCTRMDTNCKYNNFQGCARGTQTCEGALSVKSYASELKRLDDFDVYRVAIGVGGGSATEKGSALYEIDNNVMKDQGYLPQQYLTTDSLSRALKTLCVPTRPPSTKKPVTPAPIGLAPPVETEEPTVSPAATYKPVASCADDVVLIKQTPKEGTSCGKPLTIRERDKNTVTFTINNTWKEELDRMYIQYYGLDRNEHCWRKDIVTKTSSWTFKAYCWENVPITVVTIWVSDSAPGALNPAIDNAVVPECCGGPGVDPNPKVQYTFMVSCYCIPPK